VYAAGPAHWFGVARIFRGGAAGLALQFLRQPSVTYYNPNTIEVS